MNEKLNKDLNRVIRASEDRIKAFLEAEQNRKEVEIAIILIRHNVPEPTE